MQRGKNTLKKGKVPSGVVSLIFTSVWPYTYINELTGSLGHRLKPNLVQNTDYVNGPVNRQPSGFHRQRRQLRQRRQRRYGNCGGTEPAQQRRDRRASVVVKTVGGKNGRGKNGRRKKRSR